MPVDKALEIWTAQTLCDVGILLSIVSFLLHIGRPYFERILGRFTLRVGADMWWLVYIMLRDGTLFLAFLFGFFTLNLDLMADIKVGLPFVPFGTVALAAALAVKLFRNTEDINKSFRLSTYVVTFGAFMNAVGYVIVMQGPGVTYPAAKAAFWQTMYACRSNLNPGLATITFYLTFTMLVVMASVVIVKVLCLYTKLAAEGQQDVQTQGK